MNNTILDLIQGADVEWKTLSSVDNIVTLNRGRVISKTYLQENVGDYPVYSSQTENNGEIGKIATFDYDKECLTWTTDGANAGTVFHRSGKFSVTNVCGIITINDESYLSYRFLYYWLSIVMKSYVYAGMGNPKLMSNQVERIKIPIPSLEIQQKVVEILDKMTDYVTELTAELTLRQKQYAYYRDQLLSFGAEANLLNDSEESFGVRWTTLGEVLQKTDKIKWNNVSDEKYRYIDLSSVSREFNSILETIEIDKEKHPSRAQQIVKTNDIIFGTTRPTLQRFTRINDEFDGQVASTGFVVLRPDKLKILSKFLYFSITTDRFLSYVEQNQKGASYPAISDNEVKSYKIPLPNLKAQKRIVEILDRFDKLTSDLSEGLPREIELRQKQYEYWREQLLSFNKK